MVGGKRVASQKREQAPALQGLLSPARQDDKSRVTSHASLLRRAGRRRPLQRRKSDQRPAISDQEAKSYPPLPTPNPQGRGTRPKKRTGAVSHRGHRGRSTETAEKRNSGAQTRVPVPRGRWRRFGRCAKLWIADAKSATADTWNFGLRATRSREPRQARKGATVPGKPSVPRRSRSSSICGAVDSFQLYVFSKAVGCLSCIPAGL